jgi:hypothetical protein
MPACATWEDNAQTIVRVDCLKPWQWYEYDQAIDQAYDMINGVVQKVYLIVTSDAPTLTKGLPLPHILRSLKHYPINLTRLVIVNSAAKSAFKSSMFETVFQVYPKAVDQLAFAVTVEEALVLIEKWKTTPARKRRTLTY